jgi:uncharacterized membrane protein
MLGTLQPAVGAFRLTLHILAATIWVGGQLTVAGMLPTVRGLGTDAPRAVARALGRLLWPSYAVLVATGIWNIAAMHVGSQPAAWKVVLGVKIGVVALAGSAAWLHTVAKSRAGLAAWGALAGLSSVAALALGVLLSG